MNDASVKLVARMVISTMAGNRKVTLKLYEKYLKEARLYVPIGEILEWKKEQRIA